MKKTLSIIAAALALFMALGCMPLSLAVKARTVTPCWTVPAGYNAHDYNACASFLEQTDEDGVKNGEKLSENYDPNDPATWGTYWGYDDDWNDEELTRFTWSSVGGTLRITSIFLEDDYTGYEWQALVGSFDVSGCTALENLNCSDNALTELDVSGCTALRQLNCWNNALTELDVSGCTALEELSCMGNALTELDVSGCTALEYLRCMGNALTELDVSSNTALRQLDCYGNALTELDVSNNTALTSLICYGNALTELDVSNNTALWRLYCDDNALTELDVSSNIALGSLDCSDNALTELDVSGCIALEYLNCENNALTELDVSSCTALTELYCNDNVLTELDLSGNTELNSVDCRNNRLTEILLSYTLFPVQTLRAEGIGYVGVIDNFDSGWNFNVCAYAGTGAEFLGWYDETGALVSETEEFTVDGSYTELIARFEGGAVPGDMSGDGVVDIVDALSILRAAMGLITATPEQIAVCDMDGDNELTVADALQVMRTAMSLIILD